MSEYIDDDEPEDEGVGPESPVESTPAGTFTATVAREEIVGMVAERFFCQMARHGNDDGAGIRKAASAELQRMVRERAGDEVDRVVGDGVAEVTRVMLAEGWPKTDDYGRPSGTVTVRDLVVQYLTQRHGYGDRRNTRLEKWVKDLVEEAIKKEMAPLLEEAKKQVRRVLDENVTGAIRRALLQGAGIRE